MGERKGDHVDTADVFTMNFRPRNDGPTEPNVRVPNVNKVRVTKGKGGTRNKGLLHDVWGTVGDDPTNRMPRRMPRASRVVVRSFTSGRGIERKQMNGYLDRCGLCDRSGQWAAVRITNVGKRCRLHAPQGRGEMGKLRVSGTGRWA